MDREAIVSVSFDPSCLTLVLVGSPFVFALSPSLSPLASLSSCSSYRGRIYYQLLSIWRSGRCALWESPQARPDSRNSKLLRWAQEEIIECISSIIIRNAKLKISQNDNRGKWSSPIFTSFPFSCPKTDLQFRLQSIDCWFDLKIRIFMIAIVSMISILSMISMISFSSFQWVYHRHLNRFRSP